VTPNFASIRPSGVLTVNGSASIGRPSSGVSAPWSPARAVSALSHARLPPRRPTQPPAHPSGQRSRAVLPTTEADAELMLCVKVTDGADIWFRTS
jgi:hypothetical protein